MMQWNNTGSGVYTSDNDRYIISRLPAKKKFILMRRIGGKIGEGTLAQCKAQADKDLMPYHGQLAQLAKRGFVDIMSFRSAFVGVS